MRKAIHAFTLDKEAEIKLEAIMAEERIFNASEVVRRCIKQYEINNVEDISTKGRRTKRVRED